MIQVSVRAPLARLGSISLTGRGRSHVECHLTFFQSHLATPGHPLSFGISFHL